MPYNETVANLGLDEYKYGFKTENKPVFQAARGLNEDIVRQISAHKGEPEWMLEFRLDALKTYYSKPMPHWGGDLTTLESTLDDIYYYLKPQEKMALLEMDPTFAERSVNEGFSGGEKKRNEILQLAMLNPVLAVMDETDSGLDIDALKVVSNGINTLHQQHGEMSILLITHYQRMLDYIKADHVHVMVGGRIVRSGGPELAQELEAEGYAPYAEEVGADR